MTPSLSVLAIRSLTLTTGTFDARHLRSTSCQPHLNSYEEATAIRNEQEVIRALARAKLDKGDRPVEEPASKLIGAVGWEADVIQTHRRFEYYPHLFRKKEYEVLAFTDEFTPREKAPEWMPEPKKGVLLGKPLFVAGD